MTETTNQDVKQPEIKPAQSSEGATKEVFTKEYVGELREETKSLRSKLVASENLLTEEIKKRDQQYESSLQQKIEEVSSSYKREIMISKLETEAIKAGIIDVDGIKLADLSKIALDENNKVQGAAELIEELKAQKPYLFKKYDSSTNSKPLPKPSENKETINVMDMTKEEYEKYEKKFLGKR